MTIVKNRLNLSQNQNNSKSVIKKKDSKSNYGQNINFCGAAVKPREFALRQDYFKKLKNWVICQSWIPITGFITALMSVIGFGVGGIGLIYDSMVKKNRAKDGKQEENTQEKGVLMPPVIPVMGLNDASSASELRPSSLSSYLQQVNESIKQSCNNAVSFTGKNSVEKKDDKKRTEKTDKKGAEKDKPKSSEGEYGHIVPVTKLGKTGLTFAKIAITVSGTAGFLTGLALNVPLMSLGEVIGNVLAAPIITSPAGFGLMTVGIAFLLIGRAFENNPALKFNPAIFANKNLLGKVTYTANNILEGLKETGKSWGNLGKNIGGLFKSSTRGDSKNYFNEFVSLNSSTMSFTQKVLANGKDIVESGLKSNSSRLHTFAGIMAVTGLVLVVEDLLERVGIIKTDKPRKVCFNIAKIGQYADNIGLGAYGAERAAKFGAILGAPVMASAAIALTGAHKVDEDEGKGRIWAALSFFFMLLAIERGIETLHAFKSRRVLKAKPVLKEAAEFIRMIDVNLSGLTGMNGKNKKQLLNLFRNRETAWLQIKYYLTKPLEKADELIKTFLDEKQFKAIKDFTNDDDKLLKQIPPLKQKIEEILSGVHVNKKLTKDEIIKQLEDEGCFTPELIEYLKKPGVITIKGKDEELPEILSSIHKANVKKFGENYLDYLKEITADTSSSPDFAKDAANNARKKFRKELGEAA